MILSRWKSPTSSSKPLPYTANPILLILNDLMLFAQITFTWPPTAGLPSIILPLTPARSKGLDELALTGPNLWSDFIHLILVVAQTLFLVSLIPLSYVLLPFLYFLYIVAFVYGNQLFTVLLNGRRRTGFQSNPKCVEGRRIYEHEQWVFINGVAVGQHWLQSNLDRLAMTFRRPICGIHNQTRGIIFDVLECIIQRDLAYPTLDIRQAYDQLLAIISNPKIHKVVLIVHSQGAIEGGMVLDWLYSTVAAEQIRKLEVYTFGNAANHWNAPVITTTADPGSGDGVGSSTANGLNGGGRTRTSASTNGHSITNTNTNTNLISGSNSIANPITNGITNNTLLDDDFVQSGRVVRYIEHYANTGDYVSRFGILHFRPVIARRVLRGAQPQPQPQPQGKVQQRIPPPPTPSPLSSSITHTAAPQDLPDAAYGSSAPGLKSVGTAGPVPVQEQTQAQAQAQVSTSTSTPTSTYAPPTYSAPAPSVSSPVPGSVPGSVPARSLKLATKQAIQAVHSHSHPHSNILSPTTPFEKIDFTAEDDNKFVGRLFKRVGSGHQFNQHYMDTMFEMEGVDTRDLSRGRVKDGNAYMDALVDLEVFEEWDTVQAVGVADRGAGAGAGGGGGAGRSAGGQQGQGHGQGQGHARVMARRPRRVKELSRLWAYRNGGNPDEVRR